MYFAFILYDSCFISDMRVLIGVMLAPMGVVMIFSIIMVVLAFRLVVQQNRKKFFQGGEKYRVKLTIKSIVSLVWLIVLFGVCWLFGLMTVREASTVFQYLFVLCNAFQGFYFFLFVCLNQKEARDFWAYMLTLGHFKISKLTMPHNKMYANNSDYKVRGNHPPRNVASLPVKANLIKKPQLVEYLSLPNPRLLANSFVSNNESVIDPGSFALGTISELREEEQTRATDTDSRIEVTTYFTSEEIECMSTVVADEGVSPDDSVPQEPLQSDVNDNSAIAINFEVPQNGFMQSEFEKGDATNTLYVNPELLEECESAAEEEAPVPPQHRKRKTENTRSATQEVTSDLDEVDTTSPHAPPRRKHKTVASSTAESGGGNKGHTQDDKWPTRDSEKEQSKRSAAITRQDKITADPSLSRQRQVIEPMETAATNGTGAMGSYNEKEE